MSLQFPNNAQPVPIPGAALGAWYDWALQAAATVATTEGDSRPAWASELGLLLQDVADLDRLTQRLGLYRTRSTVLCRLSLEQLTQLWQQRLQQRTPLQYLLGMTDWREFRLQVSPAVLIPRPETELIVDLAVAAMTHRGLQPDKVTGHWLDLGTGSGAIALALATVFPQATIHAVDLSDVALAIAQANAHAYELQHRIQFYQGSWFTPLPHLIGQCQGIISNPPYIPTDRVPHLQPEVAHHEPHLALDGGPDGLASVRELITTIPQYLQTSGVLLMELMAGQAPLVGPLLKDQQGYQQVTNHQDWAGITRFMQAIRS